MGRRENVNNRTATGGTKRNAFYNACRREKIIGWRERERKGTNPFSRDALFSLPSSPSCDVIPHTAGP